MRIVVTYPLAIAFTLLMLETLWLSAALVSRDIAGHEMQSLAVKPIRPVQIWGGKWMGLLAINLGLIALTTSGILLTVNTLPQRRGWTPTEQLTMKRCVLVGRRAIHPPADPDLAKDAVMLHQALALKGNLPETTPVARLRHDLKMRNAILAPGDRIAWSLPMPPLDNPLSWQYRFRCDALERTPISGTWTFKTEASTPLHIPVQNQLDGIHHFMLPAAFQPQGQTLTVTFEQTEAPNAPTIFFDADAPVTLLVHENSFCMNLLRAAIGIFALLASVAAIGLTMSTLFSFPVAVFAAGALLFAVALAGSYSNTPVGHHHGPQPEPTLFTSCATSALLTLKQATAGVSAAIPIPWLANGMLYSWHRTGMALATMFIMLPSVLAALSSLMLSRKELAA